MLRSGRITAAQSRALEELAPRYLIATRDARGPVALDMATVFGRAAPVSLEIGIGNGENLVQLAARHPERDWLGVEVHRPGIGHAMLLAERAGLANLRLACDDAEAVLRDCIAPGALDEVLILFPDPWHKKRHHKRRLIQPAFVELLASRLAPGGHLRLATDWIPYAEWILEVLRNSPPFENLSATGDWVPRPDWRVPTRFERRGERLGHEVRDLAFKRRSSP